MRHRLAIAIAALLLLAGCSDDSPEPSASPSTSRPTASPSPTVAADKPTLPAAARSNTPEGAEAFVRYWFETTRYAAASGDTKPLAEASAPGCATCKGIIANTREIYDAGGHMVGGGLRATAFLRDPQIPAPDYRFRVKGIQPEFRVLKADGSVLSSGEREPFVLVVGTTWDDGFRVFAAVRADG